MEPRIPYLLLSLIFFFYAIYLGWKIFEQKRKLDASQSWPFAEVQIRSKLVAEGYARYWKVFTPKIFYAYIVDGKSITGMVSLKPALARNAAWLSPDSESFLKARKTAEHRLDKMAGKLEIRYNPGKPEERVCSLDPIRKDVPRLLLSLLVALAIVFLYLIMIR